MTKMQFKEGILKHTPSLNAYAYNLTKNPEEARDLYQEMTFRAFSNMDKFRPGTNLKAWLTTIMKNIFINNYRVAKRKPVIIDHSNNSFIIDSSPRNKVKNGAASNILMDELQEMIHDLKTDLKTPFIMAYEGYKYDEIAEQLNIPIGTVKSRIFFARKELKNKITKLYPGYSLN